MWCHCIWIFSSGKCNNLAIICVFVDTIISLGDIKYIWRYTAKYTGSIYRLFSADKKNPKNLPYTNAKKTFFWTCYFYFMDVLEVTQVTLLFIDIGYLCSKINAQWHTGQQHCQNVAGFCFSYTDDLLITV